MIRWSGLDEHGKAWDDTWEPAEYIEKDGAEELKRFFAKRKAAVTLKKVQRSRKSRKRPQRKIFRYHADDHLS